MTKIFTRKLYLLGREYSEAVDRIFGKENVEKVEITPTTRFADRNAQYFYELAGNLNGPHNHILIVTGYEAKQLTMFKLAGLPYLIFEVKSEDDQDTLNDWFRDYQTFLSWWDSSNEFLSAQETLLNNSESMFDDDYYGVLYNTNFDLVDMKDRFEEVYREGFEMALEKRFSLSS